MSRNLLILAAAPTLGELRDTLVRLEDTIIFALIERSQFKHNNSIYEENKMSFKDGYKGSFLTWFLKEVEHVHAKVRRYQSPDEYPFTGNLPEPVLPPLDYPPVLVDPQSINVNEEIFDMYVNTVVPGITQLGDDTNYGSSATRDIECLQALSRRIHYGKFVAESKFQDPESHDEYVRLIREQNRDRLMELLTNSKVEELLLKRLKAKAIIYGQDLSSASLDANGNVKTPHESPLSSPVIGGKVEERAKTRVDYDLVVSLYRDYVIPLTKEVEVEYLLHRLDSD
ncbi:chorismate mutase aro7 [Coemansia sp. RSA 455]|nr:chorismate mutase aro7 [Coemansia sp. S17]KAJ2017150.1 chorismate mutase aro7 [Coemansia sp. S680]KAJ2026766.1 chorismate mutase aro7 [Coemansia sp. S3946]KAJ2042546.1 chorismate mutase aro7 [Coemansia sp. S16]KAJ2055362.1 chorismate mutase aro7 [Coemansia sp. S155-1]KAJ2087559.1 chorismate mutase aro7 [Coemansia sp. S100]KAJ2093831.1 chorismate mutase aro7 [Coemansia sp. S142-1]KAJ2104334.1 chorismate mutase aro7 [Coemansia sp. RSA 922]KAJ2248866.1 chorismate mutase aro7 [Coemansia sp. 